MRYISKPEQWEDTEFVRRGELEKKQRDKQRATEQVAVMLKLIGIVADAIREAGDKGIPSGHLYAMMVHKVPLQTYQYAIGILKDAGAVTEEFHLLRWTGQCTIPTL